MKKDADLVELIRLGNEATTHDDDFLALCEGARVAGVELLEARRLIRKLAKSFDAAALYDEGEEPVEKAQRSVWLGFKAFAKSYPKVIGR